MLLASLLQGKYTGIMLRRGGEEGLAEGNVNVH